MTYILNIAFFLQKLAENHEIVEQKLNEISEKIINYTELEEDCKVLRLENLQLQMEKHKAIEEAAQNKILQKCIDDNVAQIQNLHIQNNRFRLFLESFEFEKLLEQQWLTNLPKWQQEIKKMEEQYEEKKELLEKMEQRQVVQELRFYQNKYKIAQQERIDVVKRSEVGNIELQNKVHVAMDHRNSLTVDLVKAIKKINKLEEDFKIVETFDSRVTQLEYLKAELTKQLQQLQQKQHNEENINKEKSTTEQTADNPIATTNNAKDFEMREKNEVPLSNTMNLKDFILNLNSETKQNNDISMVEATKQEPQPIEDPIEKSIEKPVRSILSKNSQQLQTTYYGIPSTPKKPTKQVHFASTSSDDIAVDVQILDNNDEAIQNVNYDIENAKNVAAGMEENEIVELVEKSKTMQEEIVDDMSKSSSPTSSSSSLSSTSSSIDNEADNEPPLVEDKENIQPSKTTFKKNLSILECTVIKPAGTPLPEKLPLTQNFLDNINVDHAKQPRAKPTVDKLVLTSTSPTPILSTAEFKRPKSIEYKNENFSLQNSNTNKNFFDEFLKSTNSPPFNSTINSATDATNKELAIEQQKPIATKSKTYPKQETKSTKLKSSMDFESFFLANLPSSTENSDANALDDDVDIDADFTINDGDELNLGNTDDFLNFGTETVIINDEENFSLVFDTKNNTNNFL